MSNDHQIILREKPDDAFWNVVGGGIRDYNIQNAGPSGATEICLVLQSPGGEIDGGLVGDTHWGWFYINLLFLKEDLRGQGYGHQLLTLAEEEARKRGATRVYLDTFSFQAPDFYLRHGYHVFGELKDFPPGHTRYYLTKEL